MEQSQRKKLGRICLVAWFVTSPFVFWRGFIAYANPFIIYNDDPSIEVYVDGNEVEFTNGSFTINPWRSTYVVAVRIHGKTEQRVIFPRDPESDSGSILIRDGKVLWGVVSEPLGNPQ